MTAVHLVFAGMVVVAVVLALRGLRRDFLRVRYPDSAGSRPELRPELRTDLRPELRTDPGAGDLVARLLAVAIVSNLIAYGLLYHGSGATVREIAPVFGLGGALAGRVLGEPLLRRRLEPLLAVGAVAAVATLVTALVAVIPGQPASASLARFLSAQHLRSGWPTGTPTARPWSAAIGSSCCRSSSARATGCRRTGGT